MLSLHYRRDLDRTKEYPVYTNISNRLDTFTFIVLEKNNKRRHLLTKQNSSDIRVLAVYSIIRNEHFLPFSVTEKTSSAIRVFNGLLCYPKSTLPAVFFGRILYTITRRGRATIHSPEFVVFFIRFYTFC